MFSIICIYNDKKKVEKYLLKTLQGQDFKEYELILIDNSNNQKYYSAMEAIEDAVNQAKESFIMIIHQDIIFESNDTLRTLSNYVNSISNLGVAGIAGAPYKNKSNTTLSCIKQGKNREYASNNRPNNITECQTVDECLFIIPRKILKEIKFTYYGNSWHLYAVDYCLNVLKHGYKVVVLPINSIYHLSPGDSLDKSYYYVLKKIIKNYRDDYELFHTTMGTWNKNAILLKVKFIVLRLKCFIRLHRNIFIIDRFK